MAVSEADFDVFYGTTIVNGVAVAGAQYETAYLAHKTYGWSETENLQITVSWKAHPSGMPGQAGIDLYAYSLLPNNDNDASYWEYVWRPVGYAGDPYGTYFGDGSATLTIGRYMWDGPKAFARGEFHVMLEVSNADVTDVVYQVTPAASVGVPTLVDTTPTYADATDITYDDYFSEVVRVWDDVAVAAWTQYGSYPVRFRAMRVNPDMTVTFGPQVEAPNFIGSPGQAASLGDGAALFTTGRDYNDPPRPNTVGWVVKVDQSTLVCTISTITAPYEFVGQGWSNASEGPNRVLMQVTNQANYAGNTNQSLVAVSWDGANHTTAWYTYQAIDGPDDQYNFTPVWLDFDTFYVRVNVAYNGTGTGDDMIQFFEHATQPNGLPEPGLGTFRFEVPKYTNWQYDNVYGATINATQGLLYNLSLSGYQELRLLDTTNWTLIWVGDLGQGEGNLARHYDDWAGVVATTDIENAALVADTPWPDTAGARVSLFSDGRVNDATQVYPWGPGYETSINDHKVAYLSGGKFVSVVSANSLGDAVPWVSLGIYAIPGEFIPVAPVIPEVINEDYLGSRRRFW